MIEALLILNEVKSCSVTNYFIFIQGGNDMSKKIMCVGKVVKGQIIYLQVAPNANGLRKQG